MEVPESLDLFYEKHSRKSRETMRRRKKLFQAFVDTLKIRVIRDVAGLANGLRDAAARVSSPGVIEYF
ncbi:MAG: hypothetical protein H7833_03380 [Magnetococcus sp. DMHC-1]|nr:hypothetical protein [Magnetococcales bacterium]